MACVIEENVFRLKITRNFVNMELQYGYLNSLPIYDVESVKMFQGTKKLRGVVSTPRLVEFAFPLQVIEKLATVDYGS